MDGQRYLIGSNFPACGYSRRLSCNLATRPKEMSPAGETGLLPGRRAFNTVCFTHGLAAPEHAHPCPTSAQSAQISCQQPRQGPRLACTIQAPKPPEECKPQLVQGTTRLGRPSTCPGLPEAIALLSLLSLSLALLSGPRSRWPCPWHGTLQESRTTARTLPAREANRKPTPTLPANGCTSP